MIKQRCTWVKAILVGFCLVGFGWADEPAGGPHHQFGLSLISTADGSNAEIDFFLDNETCGVCHERHFKELKGSMHTAAHTDPLYRELAETARREAGPEVYAYCSGCHSSMGVVSGLIPHVAEEQLPEMAKAGVSCDLCHQITKLTGAQGPWREPGNASFVIQQGKVKFGPTGDVTPNRLHTGEKRDFLKSADFCASCHTVIHPISGLRIEHTYGEWKRSIYAEKGIQCQDCHMRTVEEAVQVARTLKPIRLTGQSATDGPEREIFRHLFVGGNANADRLANGPDKAQMAEQRLKSAARLELLVPEHASPGKAFAFKVRVHNVAAGHSIPTGVTELRRIWVQLTVTDGQGRAIYKAGHLDEEGRIPKGTIQFGAVAANAEGKATYKLWEMERFLWKRLIPPKGFEEDTVTVRLPSGVEGPLRIEAKLFYRTAPPDIVREILKDKAFPMKVVEMTAAAAEVAAGR